MTMEFCVLASGSSGNASLVRAGGLGVLIDVGLGPRLLGRRLRELGCDGWEIHAALLTHTHGDHWRDKTLCWLAERRVVLYCHETHAEQLAQSRGFAALSSAGLVRTFACGDAVELGKGVCFRAVPLSHDGGVTCGFRVDSVSGSLGYATDLGTWQASLAESLANVDILAVEFNHDVVMERTSRRAPQLIARVLGDAGHLSNEQAAALVREVLRRSDPGRLQHVVQLHLSRHCNRPSLARLAAQEMFDEVGADLFLHTARQDRAGPMLRLGAMLRRRMVRMVRQVTHVQLMLPGWEEV